MYNKNTNFNLFSIPRMLSMGWTLNGDDDSLVIKTSGMELRFDIKITTKRGALYCMYLKRDDLGEVMGGQVETTTSIDKEVNSKKSLKDDKLKPKIGVDKADCIFGHASEDETRKTAEALGYRVVRGTMKPCDACAAAKAKQKNVPKKSEHVKAERPNERVFLDISTVKKNKEIQFKPVKGQWRMIVDECTQMKFSDFYATKDGMVEPTCELFKKWSQDEKPVGSVRFDNAGENVKLQQRANSADWQLGINFEFTPRNTPQQNHLVEVGFAVIANKGRSLMHYANVPFEMRYKLFRDALQTATMLDGLVVVEINSVKAPRCKHYYGCMPKWVKHLRTWGEVGTVTAKLDMTPKLKDRGEQCMFIAYSMNHDGDVFRMYNPATKRVINTRDVIWMHRMYYGKKEKPQDVMITRFGPFFELQDRQGSTKTTASASVTQEEIIDVIDMHDDDSDDKSDDDSSVDSSVDDPHGEFDKPLDEEDEEPVLPLRDGKRVSKPPVLFMHQSEYHNVMSCGVEFSYLQQLKEIESYENATSEVALVGAGVGGGFENTQELHVMKYNEAMASNDKTKWEKAIEEEYERMLKHNVFQPVPVNSVPTDAKILSSTWAMKKKSNGVYRARMNARGYE